MHVLLIRHGETVDNVAGLYAGSRDSPLTNHGVLQTERLAAHLVSRQSAIGPVTHVFASDLQRAYKTAEAIVTAQKSSRPEEPLLLEVADIREKDFGSSEGKKFGTRTADNNADAETSDSMKLRIDRFIETHLVPLFHDKASEHAVTVIVSHGIILNVLLRALVSRFPGGSPPSFENSAGPSELRVAWSNTGVLQAKLDMMLAASTVTTSGQLEQGDKQEQELLPTSPPPPTVRLSVQFANNVDHLQGLKKTRGGIGSAKFDTRQRRMDMFFGPVSKKRKSDEEETSNKK